MREGLSIRDATAADAEALADLFVELGYPVTSTEVLARLQPLTGAGRPPLVAVRDGAVVGLLTRSVMHVLHRPGPVGRVSTLVVTERARGQGIGAALMAAAEARLKQQGCILIEVTSNMRRAEAHTFYERLGYERTSYRFAKPLGSG